MKLNSYPVKRANDQIGSASIKSAKLPVGTSIAVNSIEEGSFERNGKEVASDMLRCTATLPNGEKKQLRIPMREYFKFNCEGLDLGTPEDGAATLEIQEEFKITGSENRTYKEHKEVFPPFAYNAADAFYATDENVSYDELLESGVKDGVTVDPVQNYTIEV